MKSVTILSITGLMILNTQSNATVLENSQIMPPPGPYKSVMNNTPPAFVPYGYQQPQQQPGISNQNHARLSNNVTAMQQPEWFLVRQQENKEKISEMQKENEARYTEFLKKAEADAKKRYEEYKRWNEKNNEQMKMYWQQSLERISEHQKQQIEKAKHLPEWVKKQMLEQHKQQLTMMNKYPPGVMKNTALNNYPINNYIGPNNPQNMNFRPAQPPVVYRQQPSSNQSFYPRMQPMMQQQFGQPHYNRAPTNPGFKPQISPVPQAPMQQYRDPGFQNPYYQFRR